MKLSFDDLIANRTLTPEIAAVLIEAARAKRSFLVFAQPRLAGKTTLQELMLAHTPSGTPVRTVGTDGDDIEALARDARGGYLVIPEIAREAARPGYIWGEPVRTAFAARACSLAVVLHADSADEAIAIIRENGVPDADLERLELLIHLRSLGKWEEPTRRVVAHIHEGVAARRLLHRWDEATDRFEVGPPRH